MGTIGSAFFTEANTSLRDSRAMHSNTPHFSTSQKKKSSANEGNGAVTTKVSQKNSSTSNTDTSSSSNIKLPTHTLMGMKVLSCGSFVPENTVTNQYLEKEFGFEEGWVEKRTGILERRHAPDGMATSDMCVEAAERAIARSGISRDEIDLIVIGTFTPDHFIPSTGCMVQSRLGINAPAFDVSAGCSGFMYAMVTASQFLANKTSKNALVIGSDTNSRFVSPDDQRSYPLFGDGAGAVVMSQGNPDQGFLRYQLGADGASGACLLIPGGASRIPASQDMVDEGKRYLEMDGRTVFKWAVRAIAESIQQVLDDSETSIDQIDQFVFHQANVRIIDAAIELLKFPKSKAYINLDKYGNTSGGSIPLVLDEMAKDKPFEKGEKILLCGFGAGLTWGTGIFQW